MANLTEEDRNEYAEMLMKHYPHRVLAHLKSLSLDALEAVGVASEEEANANFHEHMLRETARHGAE